ncbi:MAG: helix-turn-helix domain-containing protein [Acidimicrobiales bacterium]
MPDPKPPSGDPLDQVAALSDPVRRRLYDFVLTSERAVGRDEAAEALEVGRSVAAYHLDHLVEHGLLDVRFERRTGRTGPGAGRPAKLYAVSLDEVTVQIPPRDDTLLARLLATAVETDSSGAARDALRVATRLEGAALAAGLDEVSVETFVDRLEHRGYAPMVAQEGIRLRNCPFHHLVDDHLDLVCTLNCDLLGAAVEAAELDLAAELDPQPGHCCVVLRNRRRSEPTARDAG